LKGKQATDKYGKEGANGVIEIISKSNGESNLNRNSDDKTGDNHLALNYFQPDPLIIVDGEEVTKDEMQKLEPSSIEKINVLKDKSAEDKYGAKGKNGVIEITTKKANGISNEITITSDNRNYYDTVPKNQIFTKVETEASVDKEQWRQFLQKNLQSVIEQTAIKGAKPGTYTVKVRFLVRKDGSISDFIALNDPGYGLAKKVEAIMKESPVWNPGLQNGKPVNSYHTQPITFVIQEQ
jgi:TonB-dependent SusC/RagA subfamily outer membrane receptor